MSTTAKPEIIARDLVKWAIDGDRHVKADFLDAAVVRLTEGGHVIRWSAARDAFNEGEFNRSSSTELAVLDLAIALGMDVYRFSSMGRTNKAAILNAITTALAGTR